jgi:hypothetical protein
MNLILNFLPMVLIYLIATYSPQVARISHTVLGKVIAIGLILLYCFFDIVSGLLVCALVIFYYQTDYVESFSTASPDTEGEGESEEDSKAESKETKDEEKKEDESKEEAFTTVVKNEVLIVGKIGVPIKPTVDGHEEVLSSSPGEALEDAYPLEPTITKDIVSDKKASDFRKKHCSKGHLMHKGQVVKPESAEHVFPEIKQADFHKCNICDPTCRFDLINNQSEKMLKAEENLTKPKSSNDFFEVVWNNIQISKSK